MHAGVGEHATPDTRCRSAENDRSRLPLPMPSTEPPPVPLWPLPAELVGFDLPYELIREP